MMHSSVWVIRKLRVMLVVLVIKEIKVYFGGGVKLMTYLDYGASRIGIPKALCHMTLA